MAKLRLDRLLATKPADDPYCPDVGDIIWLNFNPQVGREQSGRRRALVLSGARYNQLTRLCVVCPITSKAKGYPFESAFPDGMDTVGVVLSDQVKSLSWEARNSAFIEHAPPEVLADTKAKIRALLRM